MSSDKKRQVVNEIHKPARRKFKRRKTIIKGLDFHWQGDLIDLQSYASVNRKFKYLLVVIDCMSKYVWTKPLKSKNANDVTHSMELILNNDQNRTPVNFQTDQGKEFFNSQFNALMKKYGINHYHTYSVTKAAIVERVIRTLKEKIYRMFSLNGNYKWVTEIDNIVESYNNSFHRVIKMKPKDVSFANEKELLENVFSHHDDKTMTATTKRPKFKEGDVVRLSKMKYQFEKSYLPNWTCELFVVKKVRRNTNPHTYLLEDMSKQPISGTFYSEELQKAKYKDIYLVSKILRKKDNRVLVSWLGFPSSHNSWIKKSDLL